MDRGRLRDYIGVALIGAFVGAIVVLFWKGVPSDNRDLITYMLGQLSGFVAAIVTFHYGAKSGEKELEEQRAANTGEAFRAVQSLAHKQADAPTGAPGDPVHTVEDGGR